MNYRVGQDHRRKTSEIDRGNKIKDHNYQEDGSLSCNDRGDAAGGGDGNR